VPGTRVASRDRTVLAQRDSGLIIGHPESLSRSQSVSQLHEPVSVGFAGCRRVAGCSRRSSQKERSLFTSHTTSTAYDRPACGERATYRLLGSECRISVAGARARRLMACSRTVDRRRMPLDIRVIISPRLRIPASEAAIRARYIASISSSLTMRLEPEARCPAPCPVSIRSAPLRPTPDNTHATSLRVGVAFKFAWVSASEVALGERMAAARKKGPPLGPREGLNQLVGYNRVISLLGLKTCRPFPKSRGPLSLIIAWLPSPCNTLYSFHVSFIMSPAVNAWAGSHEHPGCFRRTAVVAGLAKDPLYARAVALRLATQVICPASKYPVVRI